MSKPRRANTVGKTEVTYETNAGSEVLYNGSQPAGYAAEPAETVNYAGCHDGEIIFDQLIMKPADQVGAPDGFTA